MHERGIVTLCDSNYYQGLLGLHASVQASLPIPVLCYDIGLLPAQREEAAAIHNLEILPLPDDPLIEALRIGTAACTPLAKPNKRIWPLWICPLLIRAAPAIDLFWLDCDLVVLRDLEMLFGFLDDGPVLTPENKAPHATPNPLRLYELMPIARPFDPVLPTLNAGVSGWRRGRDDAALAAYVAPIARAAHDEELRGAIAWHDQGALIWAVQSLGMEDRVLSDWRYNLCVDHVLDRIEGVVWSVDIAERLRPLLPEVAVLHWNGRKAPWLD